MSTLIIQASQTEIVAEFDKYKIPLDSYVLDCFWAFIMELFRNDGYELSFGEFQTCTRKFARDIWPNIKHYLEFNDKLEKLVND